MGHNQGPWGDILAAIEVDQRQRVITASDKLKEMLGGSWTIEKTVDVARDKTKSGVVSVVMPASGAVWLGAEDEEALIGTLWEIRRELVDEMDLPCTFAYEKYERNEQFDEAAQRLRMKVRRLKDGKAGASGEPSFPQIARCQIQPHTGANVWRPSWAGHRQHSRRALVSELSEKRCDAGWSTMSRFTDQLPNPNGLDHPEDFGGLVTGSRDQYLALIKADADGMGRLISTVSWQKLGEKLGKGPADAMACFSEALERCVKGTLIDAVGAVVESVEGKPYPVVPIVAAGEDLAILCRREVALRLALGLGTAFEERAIAEPSLAAAVSLGGSGKLTLSFCILYARQGYPFDIMWELAEEIESLAKEHRRNKQDGCIDYYWLESTGRPRVEKERREACHVQEGGDHWYLYSRPWTLSEARTIEKLLPEMAKISRRKWPQLATGLRFGAVLSELAYRRWLTHLNESELKVFQGICAALPEGLRPTMETPWFGNGKERRTCLLELYELMEAQDGGRE